MKRQFNLTDSRTGKTVLRFESSKTAEQLEHFLYEEKHVPYCYNLSEADETETSVYRYAYLKQDNILSVLLSIDRQSRLTDSVNRSEQARQEQKQEQEAEQACMYHSLSEYIRTAKTEKAIYEPIHKNLYAVCRAFYEKTRANAYRHTGEKTDKAYNRYYADILLLSVSGKMFQTDNYFSYVNSVYAELLSMYQAEQCSFLPDTVDYSFRNALNKATNNAIYRNYHSLHGGMKHGTDNRFALAEQVTLDGMTEQKQESILNYHDRYNTELTALKRERIDSALSTMTEQQKKDIVLSAIGYSYTEIALTKTGRTTESVKQSVKFGRNKAVIAEQQTTACKPYIRQQEQRNSVKNDRQTGRQADYERKADRQAERIISAYNGYRNFYYDINGNLCRA